MTAINLLAAAGAAIFSFLPTLLAAYVPDLLKGTYNYRFLWLLAFTLNLIWLNIPGRFDTPIRDKDSKIQKFQPKSAFRTCFVPAGWTFAIWGLIYASETLVTLYVVFFSTSLGAKALGVVKMASIYWFAGNIYQALWCIFFREEFRSQIYLSVSMLGAAAYSLVLLEMQLSEGIDAICNHDRFILNLINASITMHAAWLVAATLVNLNILISIYGFSADMQLKGGFASAIFGLMVGMYLCYTTKNVFYGLTFAWAFYGLSVKTLNDSDVVSIIGNKDVTALGKFEQFAFLLLLVVSTNIAMTMTNR